MFTWIKNLIEQRKEAALEYQRIVDEVDARHDYARSMSVAAAADVVLQLLADGEQFEVTPRAPSTVSPVALPDRARELFDRYERILHRESYIVVDIRKFSLFTAYGEFVPNGDYDFIEIAANECGEPILMVRPSGAIVTLSEGEEFEPERLREEIDHASIYNWLLSLS